MDADPAPRCPHCGRIVAVTLSAATARRSVRAAGTRRLGSTVSNVVGAFFEKEEPEQGEPVADRIKTPVRTQNVEADVKVPLLLSLCTGAIVGTGAFFAALAYMFHSEQPQPWLWSFLFALVAGYIGIVRGWFKGRNLARETLYKLEEMFGVDLDGDGLEGKPPERSVSITIEEKRGKNTIIKYLDAPLPEHKMVAVAQAIASGESFSRPALCERAGAISQTEYRKLASWMLKRGMLVEVAGNQRELTSIGRKMLSKLLDAPAPEPV